MAQAATSASNIGGKDGSGGQGNENDSQQASQQQSGNVQDGQQGGSSAQQGGQQGGSATRGNLGVGQGPSHKFASSSLYVGDLSKDVTEATLFELFNAVGPVASIRVCRDAATRQSLGYAYVNFHSTKDAERALDTMNFANIKGKQCRIMWSQRDPSLRRSNRGNVFVKCLHESIDNKTLYDTFSVFGNILSCKVATNDDGTSRKYGYVHYADEASAKKAIEGVNGMSINNQVVEACEFQPRKQRLKHQSFTNVYVKYIPRHCTQEMCKEAFTKLVSDKMNEKAEITHSVFWKPDFGVSGCFNFATAEQAATAVDVLNGFDLREVYPEPDSKSKDAESKEDNEDDDNKKSKEKSGDDDDDNDESKNKKEDNEDDSAAISGAGKGGNKNDDDDDSKNKEHTRLFACRAEKRKARDFQLAREKYGRGGYRGRGGSGRGGYNSRYFPYANLYVKHLKGDVDDEKLKEMFQSFGEISSAKVMKNENGSSRQFGFVAFRSKDSASRALSAMNLLPQGSGHKPLYVSRAQSRQVRNKRFGRGGYRGGGGGGYRGGSMYQGPFSGPRGGPGGAQGGNSQGGGYGGGGFRNNQYSAAGGIYGPPQGGMNIGGGPVGHQGPMGQQQGGGPMGQQLGGMNAQLNAMNQQGGMRGPQGGPPGGLPQMQQQMGNRMMQGGYPQMAVNNAWMNVNAAAALNQRMFGAQGNIGQINPLQQLFPQNMANAMNIGQQRGGVGGNVPLAQQMGGNPSSIQTSNFNQQTSQNNPVMSNARVAQLQSAGTANLGQASSAQMQFGGQQSVPRTGMSVQSGGVGQTHSQMQQSQPTNASVPQGQSTSVLSTGGRDSAAMKESHPLTQTMLNRISTPAEKKRLIGERLFPKIQVVEPRLAGKITGMLLEMDNKILLTLLSDNNALHAKINEALAVLQEHHKSQQNASNANRTSASNNPQ